MGKQQGDSDVSFEDVYLGKETQALITNLRPYSSCMYARDKSKFVALTSVVQISCFSYQ